MNTLEKLIQKLCPEGVEYRPLGEVCGFGNGYTPSKSCSEYWTDGDVPWFRLEDIRVNGRVLTDSIQHITKAAVKGSLFPANSLIVSTSATIGEYALVLVPALTNQRFTALSVKSEFASKIDIGFLKHMGYEIGEYCKGNINQGNFASVDMKAFRKFMFPLPPLSVQKEIVRMLDDMAGLIDALEEELAARKKQYEWYRDRLMIFGDGVERKPLGSFAEITRGGSLQKRDFTEAGIPCIHYGQIYTRFGVWTDKPLTYTSSEKVPGQKFANVGDIVMAVTSETVEDVCKCVAWIGDVPAVVSGHTAVIHHNQNPKYLSYYFHTSQFAIQKRHLAHGVKVIEVTPERLKDVIIPIPKLNDQNKIVRELDDMTALIDTIYEEIALRKQQYEYYRDKLLAFKGKPEVA